MNGSAEIEALCEVMHDAYESAAGEAGWETQHATRVPWADVPEENKATMRAAVSALLDHLNSALAPEPEPRIHFGYLSECPNGKGCEWHSCLLAHVTDPPETPTP